MEKDEIKGVNCGTKCPTCSSVIRSYFVNFNEKTKMCENVDCPHPFNTDMQFEKVDNDLASGDELEYYESRPSSRSEGSTSIMSTKECSEIDRLNQAFEADKNVHANSSKNPDKEALETRVKIKESEEQIKENIEKIKELNKKLFERSEDDDCIRNDEWLKNFYRIQETQGVQLLKQKELAKLRLKKEEVTNRKLKINVVSEKSIQIEISNINDGTDTKNSKTK